MNELIYPPVLENALSAWSIRNLSFKNRIFFAPMGLDLANRNGTFSDELFEFYKGIVDGGCGFVVLSNASVSKDSILQANGIRLYNEKQAKSMEKMLAYGEQKGVPIGVQLQHYGGQGITTYTRGKELLTPSGVPCLNMRKKDARYKVREMTQDDIKLVIEQFAESAKLAETAGAKFIQLQASNGYLLSSFQSPATNHRQDEYGGDAVARGRFLLEVIQAIRASVSSDVMLGVRLGVDDYLGDKGTQVEDFKALIPMYEAAGMDLIETSICVAETFSVLNGDNKEAQDVLYSSTQKIKEYATVPVGFAGFIKSVEDAENHIAGGTAHFVGMARALFADNELILKTVEGRKDEIHWCLWDGKCFKDKFNPRFDRVYCCVNPKYKRPE